MENTEKKDCTICYKISCKQCGWEATDSEVAQIQKGEIDSCPVCGWSPSG